MNDQEKWNLRYTDAVAGASTAALALRANTHLLPRKGRALDIACGLGANAILMAERGLETEGWDISSVAIEKLNEYARRQALPLKGECRDVESLPPPAESFDVIVVARFLSRALASALSAALRPGGVLVYQTFTRERVDDLGPRDDGYRLGVNELLALFPGLRVLVYREEGCVGDLRQGWRNEAMLIARREPRT